jgi:MipA family protein
MPDLPPTVEVGPNLNLRLGQAGSWRWDLRVPVRSAITLESRPHAIGWSATPTFHVDGLIGAWEVGARAGVLWGSRRLNATTYEVTAAQATAARPAYRADGGFAGWQLTTGISRRFDRWWVGAYVRADSVKGAVFEASPLVRRSSNVSYGLAVSWIFSRSEQRVPDPDAR